MKKLEYITILRALAILAVLVVHVKQVSDGMEYIHPYIISIAVNGARGVQLFYLLSAFTLFHSFNYRTAKEKRLKTNYFVRRFFRIAPLYYLAIIYYLWQDGTGPRYFLGDAGNISAANVLSNFTFLHGFSPYWITGLVPGGWSIAVEAIFYCFLPFLFLKIKNIQQAFNFVVISLGIRFLFLLFLTHYRMIPDQRLWHDYLFLYLPNQLPYFSLGIFLYFLIYDKTNIQISSKSFLTAAIMLLLGCSVQGDLIIPDIFGFGIAFLFLALTLHKYHPRILFNGPFLYIGEISYTLYLTHWAAIHFLTRYGIINLLINYNEPLAIINFLLNYGLVLTVAVLLSTILYHTIEQPMQKFGGRLIRKYS